MRFGGGGRGGAARTSGGGAVRFSPAQEKATIAHNEDGSVTVGDVKPGEQVTFVPNSEGVIDSLVVSNSETGASETLDFPASGETVASESSKPGPAVE